MTNLYSHNQQWPQELPFRIKLADGSTRTDSSTFSAEELAAWGYTGPFDRPSFDQNSEVLDWSGAAFFVRPMTTEEQQAANDRQWNLVRARRNQALFESDWTQLPDSPADKQAWAAYRQELRDVTQQSDPFNVTWPAQPGVLIAPPG